MAYSLNVRREVHSNRAFCVTNGLDAFELSRVSKPTTGPPSLVFCFTGQGAQWARMGRMLLEKDPVFKETFEVLGDTLSHLPKPPPWNLKGNSLPLNSYTYCVGSILHANFRDQMRSSPRPQQAAYLKRNFLNHAAPQFKSHLSICFALGESRLVPLSAILRARSPLRMPLAPSQPRMQYPLPITEARLRSLSSPVTRVAWQPLV